MGYAMSSCYIDRDVCVADRFHAKW